MKKILTLILALTLALSMCTIAFAAPPAGTPSDISIEQDGNFHSVYVFGPALVLIFEDGSTAVSSMGPADKADVMTDGIVIKNVTSVDVPAEQKTKMAVDTNSIIVTNVTEESAASVKRQIEDAYAAGGGSIHLETLTGVTAYKVNADGTITDADGKEVSVSTEYLSVDSILATARAFEEMLQERIAEERARAASALQPAPIRGSDSTGESISGGSSSSPAPSVSPTPAPTSTPTPTPAP